MECLVKEGIGAVASGAGTLMPHFETVYDGSDEFRVCAIAIQDLS